MTEVSGHVVRIGRLLVFRRVTLIAIGVDKLVVAVDMTRLACRRRVGPCQWEAGCAVIERRRLPRSCGMTTRAIMAEIPRHMIRVRSVVEIRLVALIAVCIHELIIPVHVT
jgi:hypothetical protein